MERRGRFIAFPAGAAYVAAAVVQRGTPILLLPLYARALSVQEYGQVAIVLAASMLLGALMSFGLEASVVRETVAREKDPQLLHRYLNTVGLFTMVGPLVAAVAVWIAATPLGRFGIGSDVLFFGLVAAALQTSLTVFVGAVLRARERLRAYVLLTIVSAGSTAALTTLLVVVLRAGPIGWFAGALGGYAISAVLGLGMIGHRWSSEFSRGTLLAALAFGLPLLPHVLAHWVLNLSDRVILGAFAGDAQVGVYNLAYQAAAPISLVVVAINQSLMPSYARALASVDTRWLLSRLATTQVCLAAWLGLAAILLAPPAIVALFPRSYEAASGLVPWLAVGYVLFGCYLIPMNSLSLMIGRTRWLWIPTVVAAIVNVSLNLILVPRYGAIAAAYTTAASYATLLAGLIVARRIISGPRIEYETGRMVLGVGILSLVGICTLLLAPGISDLASIAVRATVVAVSGLVLARIVLRPREGGFSTALAFGPPASG